MAIGRVLRLHTGHSDLQRWFAIAMPIVLIMGGSPQVCRSDAEAGRLVARWRPIVVNYD